MKEEKKTENLKLKEISQPTLGRSYNTGLGTGVDDCMSQVVFDELNNRGALSGTIYVCELGWTIAGVCVEGSGCCSGSGSSSGSDSGHSCYCGSNCSCGSTNHGSGYYCDCGFSCSCFSGSDGGGSGSASGLYPGDETGSGASKDPVELMDKKKFVPWDKTNCLTLCSKILSNYGIASSTGSNRVIRVVSTNEGSIKQWSSDSIRDAVYCINRHLNSNRVIIVGVDYMSNSENDKETRTDGTDHYVVITGRHYDNSRQDYYYTYMDCGTTNPDKGCSDNNRLYYFEGSYFSGSGVIASPYTVTHVRPNDGGNYITNDIGDKSKY